jgi:hypothetical protein
MGIEYEMNSASNFKLFGFATGSYKCVCKKCAKEFMGDKRAIICLECAIEEVELYYQKASISHNDLKQVIPADATNLEVFAVKESKDSPTGLQAFVGFKVNGNFGFVQIPFVDHPLNHYYHKEND